MGAEAEAPGGATDSWSDMGSHSWCARGMDVTARRADGQGPGATRCAAMWFTRAVPVAAHTQAASPTAEAGMAQYTGYAKLTHTPT